MQVQEYRQNQPTRRDTDYRLRPEQKRQFHRDGFLLVRNVLSPEQVEELRGFCTRIFDHEKKGTGDDDVSRTDIMCKYPEVRWLLTHPPLLGALRSLLGEDFAFCHEWSAHDSFFGGWHKDTTGQETSGETFHYQRDYLMVQAVFYLQDNCAEYAGGVDVIPGSHRDPGDRYVVRQPKKPTFWDKARAVLQKWGLVRAESNEVYSVPNRAGDLVIFHLRTCHKASWPQVKPVPVEHRKFAIFMLASANNEHPRRYIRWAKARNARPHVLTHDFPAEVKGIASANGFNLV